MRLMEAADRLAQADPEALDTLLKHLEAVEHEPVPPAQAAYEWPWRFGSVQGLLRVCRYSFDRLPESQADGDPCSITASGDAKMSHAGSPLSRGADPFADR